MNITYVKNDARMIKIEPNPFKKPKQKIKMKVKRMNGTQPIVNQEGKVQYKEEEPLNLTRVPGTSKTIVPMRTVNGIKTGLDEFVFNPFRDEERYKIDWAERLFKGKDKAKLQHLLEYEFGFEFDYLTSHIPNEIAPSNKENKKFFEKPESRIVLKDNINFFNMANPVHRINFYTLLAGRDVANSFSELEDGLNQDAEWYVSDDVEKEKYKLSRIERETKAAAALEDLKRHENAIQQMAKALDIDEAHDRNLSSTKAARMVYDYYNQNEDTYNRYMELYDIWKDPARRNFVIASAELYDYTKNNVIQFRNGKYTWYKRNPNGTSDTFVRTSKYDMINNFLLDPAFQEEVTLVQEEYEAKMR
jgi:hypothetical protein